IGAIIGIGLTSALLTGPSVVDALNIPKMLVIFMSLFFSPIFGLVFAGGLVFFLRRYWGGKKKRRRIHMPPAEREKTDGEKKPHFWTRIGLLDSANCGSNLHGATGGQNGTRMTILVLS
ncbi:anion permease, partial [Erwinia amylovora]